MWPAAEAPARMPVEPSPQFGLLVGCVDVENDVDGIVGKKCGFDGAEETNELLMPVALQAAPDHRAIEKTERVKQSGYCARNRESSSPYGCASAESLAECDQTPGFGSFHRPTDDGVGRWRDIEPDDVVEFLAEGIVVGQLEAAPAVGSQPLVAPDRHNRGRHNPDRFCPRANRPLGHLVIGRLQRQRHDLVDEFGRTRRGGRVCRAGGHRRPQP